MLKVTFPTGKTVIYQRANHLKIDDKTGKWTLLDSEKGGWVASIQPSAGVIVSPYEDSLMKRLIFFWL